MKKDTPGWQSDTPGWESDTPGWESDTRWWQSDMPGWHLNTPGLRSHMPGWQSHGMGWKFHILGWEMDTPGWHLDTPGWLKYGILHISQKWSGLWPWPQFNHPGMFVLLPNLPNMLAINFLPTVERQLASMPPLVNIWSPWIGSHVNTAWSLMNSHDYHFFNASVFSSVANRCWDQELELCSRCWSARFDHKWEKLRVHLRPFSTRRMSSLEATFSFVSWAFGWNLITDLFNLNNEKSICLTKFT